MIIEWLLGISVIAWFALAFYMLDYVQNMIRMMIQLGQKHDRLVNYLCDYDPDFLIHVQKQQAEQQLSESLHRQKTQEGVKKAVDEYQKKMDGLAK